MLDFIHDFQIGYPVLIRHPFCKNSFRFGKFGNKIKNFNLKNLRETFKMQSKSEEDQYRSTTTIDDLPDEVIELIFNKTSFQCALLCGLVSKRWLKVSNQNTPFMQKVQLIISKGEDIAERTFARTYKIIWLGCLDLNSNYEKLLENCEKLCLDNCRFKNMA
jgi:hypothetical protein